MERSQHKSRRPRRLSSIVREVSRTHPKTGAILSRAQTNREQHLERYAGGARLRGYEELLEHLEQLESVFHQSRRLRGLAPLIRRVRGDFQFALEVTLSGFHSAAHDAMRDVMEAEFLLREFFHCPSRIDEWVTAGPNDLRKNFQPGGLRKRHAKRLGREPVDLGEHHDYRGHSMLIHVSPYLHPFGGTGFTAPDGPFDTDVCFWEMFEHARRILFEAHRLRRKLARHIKSPWGPWRGLKRFRDAWQRTQEMQAIWMGLIRSRRRGHDGPGQSEGPRPT